MFKNRLLLGSFLGLSSLAFTLSPNTRKVDIYITGVQKIVVKNGIPEKSEPVKTYKKPLYRIINRGTFFLVQNIQKGISFKINRDCEILKTYTANKRKLEKGSFFIYCPDKPHKESFTVKLKGFKRVIFKKGKMPYDYDGDGINNEDAFIYTVFNPEKERWESLYIAYDKKGKLKYILFYTAKDNANYSYTITRFSVVETTLKPPPPPPNPPAPKPQPPTPKPQPSHKQSGFGKKQSQQGFQNSTENGKAIRGNFTK